MIVESWPYAENPASVLIQLYRLDTAPPPIGLTRDVVEKSDPDDDRGWLGRGNLATRTGQFDEATRWLDRCAARRPGG